MCGEARRAVLLEFRLLEECGALRMVLEEFHLLEEYRGLRMALEECDAMETVSALTLAASPDRSMVMPLKGRYVEAALRTKEQALPEYTERRPPEAGPEAQAHYHVGNRRCMAWEKCR
jgi:hypothetical protein